ncbi:hypothetical protein [Thermococcus sp.]
MEPLKVSGKYIAVVLVVAVVLMASQIPINVSPRVSKDAHNESLPVNWIGMDDGLNANFNGHFYVSVFRYFNVIRLWITPRDGAKTTYIRVEVRREFTNALYMEVDPPYRGRVSMKVEDSNDGEAYLIEVQNPGEGTYELDFMDWAPESRSSMHITVETREGILRYRGELPVIVLEPSKGIKCVPG